MLVIIAGRTATPMVRLWDSSLAERLVQIRALSKDMPLVETEKCMLNFEEVDNRPCQFGDKRAVRRAVLFGDSHAAQWFVPLEAAAKETGWQLRVWTKAACPWVDVPVRHQGYYENCSEWREKTVARLTGPERPDLIILSTATSYYMGIHDPATGRGLSRQKAKIVWKEGLRRNLERFLASGARVVVIRDTPLADKNYRSICLLRRGSCAISRAAATYSHFMDADISQEFGDRVTVVDFNDTICDAKECPVSRDGIVVYRDYSHITPAYAATFTPQMTRLLGGLASDVDKARQRADATVPEMYVERENRSSGAARSR